MLIHEQALTQAWKELKAIGWTKGRDSAKLARAEDQRFVSAPRVTMKSAPGYLIVIGYHLQQDSKIDEAVVHNV